MKPVQKEMRWSDALSTRADFHEAAEECAASLRSSLGAPPDLLLAFVSPHHVRNYAKLPAVLKEKLAPKVFAGCSGGGIIGTGQEIESRPALSLVAAVLPDVELEATRTDGTDIPDPDASPRAWRDRFAGGRTGAHFIILADPFSFNPEDLLAGLDYAFPESRKVGGLASGGLQPDANALFVGERTTTSGAVVVTLSGNIAVDSIVAQGCRPVGPSFQITQCERNLLLGLDGRTPLEILERMLETLSPEDQKLVQNSLFIGLMSDALREGTGDYLIRNLIGLDPERGTLSVGAFLRHGQTVQFHVRDKEASAQDLDERLETYARLKRATTPQGALLFSCIGRGKSLYQRSNHDTELFFKKVGRLPMAGFFCNGEIGPVQGSTFLHGYTSCFGIFRPAR